MRGQLALKLEACFNFSPLPPLNVRAWKGEPQSPLLREQSQTKKEPANQIHIVEPRIGSYFRVYTLIYILGMPTIVASTGTSVLSFSL